METLYAAVMFGSIGTIAVFGGLAIRNLIIAERNLRGRR